MNYTENYQLPQWEETDRVLRTDFNDAMEKVDEGLGELGRRTLVKEMTLEESQSLVRITLEDTDWKNYGLLVLRPLLLTSTNYTADLYFNQQRIDRSVMTCHNGSDSLSDNYAYIRTHPVSYYQQSTFNEVAFDLTTDVVSCAYRYAFSYTQEDGGEFWIHATGSGISVARSLRWDEVTEIDISCTASMQAGSTFQLWGIK